MIKVRECHIFYVDYLSINFAGASLALVLSGCPEQLAMFGMKGFKLKQPCTGSETNLTECEIHILGDSERCYCGEVAEIYCQLAGKKNAGNII